MSLAMRGLPTDATSPLSKAVDDAVEEGVLVVVGAGNEGWKGSQTITVPSDAWNAITVGAVNDNNTIAISDDTLWEASGRGPTLDQRPKPDVVTPGVNIIAPVSSDSAFWQAHPEARVGEFYAEGRGTSMATPHVSGTVALMLEANPNLTPAQVKAILRQTAKLNPNLSGLTVNDIGYGIIDAYDAVQLAQNVNGISQSYMYDSWNVETPSRDFGRGERDYLTFTVDFPSLTFGICVVNVEYHYTPPLLDGESIDYRLIWRMSASHVWIDGTYYDLGTNMNRYLFSGPRIYEKGSGYVLMRSKYKVGNVFVEYQWKMHVDEMWLKLTFGGGSSWRTVIYIDPTVWDASNYAYLPSTGETISVERRIHGDVLLDIRDQDHTEYVQIDPTSTDNPIMWILQYGYLGNNPDSALNGDYIFNRDIVVYYQANSYIPDPGPTIYRKTNPPATPNATQNDAGSGGDAGNNFNQATSISPGYYTYTGILSHSDPEDTTDWYKFNAENGESISVSVTPPSGVDFDLQLYNPDGNLKAASYNGAGQTDSVSYTADSSGYWRAKIYISSGEGEYSFSVSNGSSGGESGCPILYVYNGKEYVSQGLLDIHNPDGIDVVTNHTLITTPKRMEDKYLLRLIEHPQTISYIDQVKFFAILEDKTLIELPLISAIHSEHGDVLPQLLLSDDSKTDVLGATHNNGISQSVDLKFKAVSPNTKTIGFLFQIEGNNPLFK